MKIAACLITKDSERTLERCLASIRPFVDGIFIYDTGSTDGTFELVEKIHATPGVHVCAHCGTPYEHDYGDDGDLEISPVCACDDPDTTMIPFAPVVIERGEWRQDFSWAREQSFAMPTDDYDWLLWLDDDDEIHGADQFRQLAATAPPELDGFVLYYDYARDGDRCICQLYRERLIRRDRGYTWKGVVHEVLVPPEGRVPQLAIIDPSQARYVHRRELAAPDRYAPDRNLKLLHADALKAEQEGKAPDPRTLAYLGTETMAKGDFAEGARYLDAYLRHPESAWSDERMQVHHKLALCLRMLGNAMAAVEVEFQALKERDDWGETYVGLCESYATLGDWARTERWAKRALETGMPQSPLILNPLEFTFVPMVRLSEACINTGRFAEAQEWLEKAAVHAPEHPLVTERRPAYAQARYEGEVTGAVLLLRETLIRFDENEKALRLLEDAVPYVIADRPEIVMARAAQRENCRHLIEPDEYRRWYVDEPKESTVTDEFVPRAAEVFHRVGFLEAGLVEQEAELGRKPDVLDLGCNDFWVGAYLMTRGYRVDGVELNRRSHDLALERASRFTPEGRGEMAPLIAHGDLHDADRLLEGRRYDAVSLFEVIEHVPDTAATLAVCEKLLRPGGRVYVSTPDGAFEKGNLGAWNRVERKGHLRAWPALEFAERASDRGDVKTMDFGQGLTVLSYTPRRKKGKVVLYAGGCYEHWNPAQIHERGLGGSETALVQVSTRLAQAGWNVKVYADVDDALTAGGVIWRPHTAWDPMEDCDAMIVSRVVGAFGMPMRAKVRALWCHDHSYPGALTPELAERMTHVVTLSEWQRERFGRLYPFLDGKLQLIRNGITVTAPDGTERFPDAARPFADRKLRCVYSSSADRGLDTLLEMWPEIRRKAPGAELHVFYGWDVFDRVAVTTPALQEYKQRVLALVDQAGGESGGVFMRGRVGQQELYREMQDARVWTYPTAFLETSCIGAMEARAAGLAIVTSDLGALRETVGSHGVRIAWGPDEDAPQNQDATYRRGFVSQTVRLLTDESAWAEWHGQAVRGVSGLDWSGRAREWERLIRPRTRSAGKDRRRKVTVAA